MWQSMSGRLVFDPPGRSRSVYRCIVEVEPGLDGMWRWLLDRCWWMAGASRDGHRLNLIEPHYGPHVSVVRGEVPPVLEGWGHGSGRTVMFEYCPQPRRVVTADGRRAFWFLDVRSEDLNQVRHSPGLPWFSDERYQFHLTVGWADLNRGP